MVAFTRYEIISRPLGCPYQTVQKGLLRYGNFMALDVVSTSNVLVAQNQDSLLLPERRPQGEFDIC
jgi:hypothetical protein